MSQAFKELRAWMEERGWTLLREAKAHTIMCFKNGATMSLQRHGVGDTGRRRQNAMAKVRRLERYGKSTHSEAPQMSHQPGLEKSCFVK